MKKVNLLTKYTLIYFSFLIILLIILSNLFHLDTDIILISGISGLIMFLISTIFFYREISRPLENILNISGKLRSGKDSGNFNNFDLKISELSKIIDEINEVRLETAGSREMSELINEIYLIAERILNELELAKVFKVNRNEFMGNVAHELRTPIFAIQLSLETLIDGAVNDEKVNMDFLNRAFNQSRRLKELVEDLISIAKFETGLKMSKRYFVISNVISKTLEELKTIAENKKINLRFDETAVNGVQVFGDEERLKQVLVNLIDNAIKYTPEDGTIEVSVNVLDKEVIVKVQDSGIGIPKKDLPRIFERFYRVDKTRSRDVGGSGLGLSIVKHILEAHSSQIKVESEENKGTKFEFNLKR
ncbi:MAG: GHKL domain-containing protein [Bacteroidetes bacterium]|nr:GHKL domain-containing protein [Bacteroidota bacterium]